MRRLTFCSISSALLVSAALHTQAVQVSISGGFTDFSSSITPPDSVPAHTYVYSHPGLPMNGDEVFPQADGTPFHVPLGSVSTINFAFTDSSVQNLETPNVVKFTPGAPANVTFGQEFKLGTFHIENGIWFGDADMGFSIHTVSPDPALSGFTFTDILHMHLNPFVSGHPELGADSFYFTGSPQLQPILVYELFDSPIGSNAVDVDFFGKISSLDPTRFANLQGGGFLGSNTTVPDAGSTAMMLLIGLGTLNLTARRLKT